MIQLPETREDYQILYWTWTMTTWTQFLPVFQETTDNEHCDGYANEQWTIWLREPLHFAYKWPTTFETLVRAYEKRRQDYLNKKDV